MKNLVGVLYLFSGLCFGKFFESNDSFFESSTSTEIQYFQEEERDENQMGFFYSEYNNPEYSAISPGNPEDPVPIDQWLFLLPLIALGGGVYFIRHKKNLEEKSVSS